MKIKLINEPSNFLTAKEQILLNRGLSLEEINKYLNLSDDVINSPLALGEERLEKGRKMLFNCIDNNKRCALICDCDCDGYTSGALLLNYLYKVNPEWTTTNLKYFMHDGKQHGLSDLIEEVRGYDLVILPDAGSGDYEYHKILSEEGSDVLIIDHHLAERESEYAVVINNQLCDYPNKHLSGVGVTWQFCRYIDSVLGTEYSKDLLDLVALGLVGDMVSLKSLETRRLITKGLNASNIKNPFIDYMIDKNAFPLSKAEYQTSFVGQACTSIGAAFFIVPFVNAVTRSGTKEEKELIFNSMLTWKAFERIPEIKRNKPTGDVEPLVKQAVRVIGNVKNRQSKKEEESVSLLNKKIEKENLLDNKILLFLLKKGEVPAEIRGLCANKMMAKYQKPCIVLTERESTYEGSMRGYTKNGLENFKELLEKCDGLLYCAGHENAGGVGIDKTKTKEFLDSANFLLKDMNDEPLYKVDYYFKEEEDNNDKIIEIAKMNDYWGQDIDRALVAIDFTAGPDNVSVMKGNTLKVSLPNGLSLIKFSADESLIEQLTSFQNLKFTAVCKCNLNTWLGNEYPQLIIEEIEQIKSKNVNWASLF